MENKSFWICGKHAVIAAIKNQNKIIHQVLISEKNNKKIYIKDFDFIKNKILFADDRYISRKIKNFTLNHQGFAALVSIKEEPNFCFNNKTKCFVALDGVTDARNIGSIIRTCSAFDINGIILKDRDFKKDSLSIYKSASGGIEKLNVFTFPNIKYPILDLKKNNFKIVSFSSDGKKAIDHKTFDKKNVFIFGSEDRGISKNLLEKSDEIVRIEIKNIESLNVSNSVSAVLSIYQFLNNSEKKSE